MKTKPANDCARCRELERQVLDLAILLQRVMHAGTPIRKQAWDYLGRHGLHGSPLRAPKQPKRQGPCGSMVVHGVNCNKAPHTHSAYMHDEADDSLYLVDGIGYCGRCHYAVDVRGPEAGPD